MNNATKRQELLAIWKHCSSVLGCNPGYQKQLDTLAHNIWQQLQGSVEGLLFLLNPCTPETIRNAEFSQLIRTKSPEIPRASKNLFLEAVASSNLLNVDIEADILNSGKHKLIIMIAKNPHATYGTLKAISHLNEKRYMQALIDNPKLHQEILERICQRISTGDLQKAIEHPNMSADLLERLGEINLNVTSLPSYQRAKARFSDSLMEIDSLIKPDTEKDMLRAVAQNIQLWQHYWRNIIMSGDFPAMLQLATNRSVSTNVLKTMVHPMQREEIKIAIANREDMPTEIILMLLADDECQVRLTAAQNPHITIPPSVIHELAFDEWDESVLTALLTRAETSRATLKSYFDRIVSTQSLQTLLVKASPGIPELVPYAVAVDPGLLGYAAQRADCPPEILEVARNSPILTEQIAGSYSNKRYPEDVLP